MAKLTDSIKDLLGSPLLAPTLQTNFFSSRTWTAPQDGYIVVRAMGAGGGGARGVNATGGYSGSWGAKALRVAKGDTVVVNIGAGGAGKTTTDGIGSAGGDTTVTVKGVTYTAYGGPGGLFNAASAPPNGPSPSANWDFGAASVKPGWAMPGSVRTGGAGVDILAQGGNATTSDSTADSGGGGTGSPSVGTIGGGAIGTKSANGQNASGAGIYLDASNGEWGISFYGGSGSTTNTGAGGNGGGGGGAGGGAGGVGGNGGGGGGGRGGAGGGGEGHGGIGGGGGAASPGWHAGNGGQGYAHLKFYADMKI